jgi:hypothetical protein
MKGKRGESSGIYGKVVGSVGSQGRGLGGQSRRK